MSEAQTDFCLPNGYTGQYVSMCVKQNKNSLIEQENKIMNGRLLLNVYFVLVFTLAHSRVLLTTM